MLTYSLSDTGSDCLYEHLYKCIKNDIIAGKLTSGEKLPSKRSFAKNLGISTITVENAYNMLMTEGWIFSIPKKGYFVSDINAAAGIPRPASAPRTESGSAAAPVPSYVADFTSNQTRPEQFPFSVWARIMRELLSSHQEELLTNPPVGGIMPLRRALADSLREFHGISVKPEQIIIGAGAENLYGVLLQLLGNDRIYGVEDPGYGKVYKIFTSFGAECRRAEMDGSGVKVSELRDKQIDVIHTSPSHHYPTGIVTPVGRRFEYLAWASESGRRYIIEDDYDSEFRLKGRPVPPLISMDVQEKVIYMNTFTKTLASTVRIGYMVLPPHLAEKYMNDFSFSSCPVPTFEQYALTRFITGGYFEKHINRLRNHYYKKKNSLMSAIRKSPLKDCVSTFEEDSGLHFLMKFEMDMDDSEFCKKLASRGVRMSPLSSFYANPPEDTAHKFVINYSNVKEENIAEAVKIICETIESAR
ncbi:MAG: PLP-dependent aminotransferase family protein [Anaerovoracaceae bacterium]|jgi:GntR family transcriptional regulator/MocR family aminotransferase